MTFLWNDNKLRWADSETNSELTGKQTNEQTDKRTNELTQMNLQNLFGETGKSNKIKVIPKLW